MEIKRVINGKEFSFVLSDREMEEAHKERTCKFFQLELRGNFYNDVPEDKFKDVAEVAYIYYSPGDCTESSAVSMAVEDYLNGIELKPVIKKEGRMPAMSNAAKNQNLEK